MKNKLSLVTSKCITYVANGVGWVAYACLSVFDNLVCSVFAIAALLICIIITIKSHSFSAEPDDEMSEYNLMKAKAATMDWLRIIICLVLVLIAVAALLQTAFPAINENINLSFGLVVPLILGITDIATGLFFVKYEKDGE